MYNRINAYGPSSNNIFSDIRYTRTTNSVQTENLFWVSIEHDSIAIMRSANDDQLVHRKHRMRNTPIANIPFVDLFLRNMHSSRRFGFLNLSRLPALLSRVRYHFFLVLHHQLNCPIVTE